MNLKIKALIETAIYAEDLNAAEEFYTRILGLKSVAREPGRHVFFHVGDSNVLLVFNPQTTLKGEAFPSHGATGPSHFAMGIEKQALDAWREQLKAHGISIEKEIDWPVGGKSIYFRDPAGNSVELITPGVWQLPSGW